jgi:hypothetical protein
MKYASLILMLLLLTVASLFAQTSTSVPQLVHYTGTLTAANGKPVTQAIGVTFLIYSEPAGGEALWMETQEIHPDTIGHYAVELGAASQGLPADLFSTTEARWLAIQAPGQLETARQRLVSVPYALKAGDAETLGGLPLSAFVLAKDNRTAAAENASEASAALQVKPAATTPTAGTVTSVSLSAPTSDFAVTSKAITKTGTLAFKWTTPPTSSVVYNSIVKRDSRGDFWGNDFTATGNIEAYGTLQTLKDANVIGSFLQGKTTKGIRMSNDGLTVSLDSLGSPLYVNWLSGQNTVFNNQVGIGTFFPQAELNLNYGGGAIADTFLIGNNTTKGLQMRDNGTGVDIESFGVPLYVNYVTNQNTVINPNGGTTLIGKNAAPNYDPTFLSQSALWVGAMPGNNNNYTSAIFSNDILVEGNLLVEGTKNFEIDHPLDPLNKTLDHAAIESSEVLNQYSGNITLDANGEATVNFPDWFSSINTDFRYQLTAVGAPGPNLYVAKKVNGNRFTIAGGTPGMEVSWQVTGKRNDAYMQAHPFQVERTKSEKMRGHSMLPGLNAPKSLPATAAR